ncbi:sulfite exporter TauE/SafE family protein [Micromonospora soli]|uniref:sulfite exporter TauE/SafE family protein n=1 Tax=Micromonospora sp. NBRC 110009 TaxID=3061627 RepID=UPI0026734996|nr:sulfite exporter TauE/SafE family protein [Micromonospora sp. NBRC 110009]WKT98127.1 sulfite exporter TauE/SafE family protein [Micromonospora sp. NBRC 110009]
MNLGAVLVTGLFAGGVSCAAAQGGLLTGLVARQRGVAASNTPGARPEATAGCRQERAVALEPREAWPERVLGGLRAARDRAGDDLAPVAAFLGGKLVSHTLLGALLGALGAAVQLSPTMRVWTQLAAGALIMAFGLAQLGVNPFTRLTIGTPTAWSRFVRGRARSEAAFAPALLGFVTILVPCGVTLSVEALAVASSSALAGAATMAVFVIGTAPQFTILGYVARAAAAWRSRLVLATGLLMLGIGLYTLNAGLTLADSPLAARNLSVALGFGADPAVGGPAVVHRYLDGRQEVVVTARSDGYEPANVAVAAGVPTTLVVRSQNNHGCTRALVVSGLERQWMLPESGETRIDLGVLQPGVLSYTCGMGMYGGQLTITNRQQEGGPERPIRTLGWPE